MENNSYYVVSGWMVNQLKLKGNELHIFAIIYGFSKDGNGVYHGGNKYLSETIGATKNTIIKALKSLEEKQYIIKTEKEISNVKFNEFSQNERVVQKMVQGGAETGITGGAEITPNNKLLYNKDNNKEDICDLFGKPPVKKQKKEAEQMFLNSPSFEISIFKEKLKELNAAGVNLEYYHGRVLDWSDSNTKKKRTARGWIATARTFMANDKEKGKLKMIETEAQFIKKGNDEKAFLNI